MPKGFKTQSPRPEIPVALGAPGWAQPSHPQPMRAERQQGKKTPNPSLPFPSSALFSFFFSLPALSPAWSCPKQPLPLHNIKCMLKSQLFRGEKTQPTINSCQAHGFQMLRPGNGAAMLLRHGWMLGTTVGILKGRRSCKDHPGRN